MKNVFKKFASFFLVALLFVTIVGSQSASASSYSNNSWDISFIQVGSGIPHYSSYTPIGYTTAIPGETYKLSTNCVVFQYMYPSYCANTWVWIDGDNQNIYSNKVEMLGYKVRGNICYTTLAIPNLAPGTHSLEIRIASPDRFSSEMKHYSINIVVPDTATQTTDSAVTGR